MSPPPSGRTHGAAPPQKSATVLSALASSLNNLSVRLGDAGDGVLAAIREAVVIRRRPAQDNPARFFPGLAGSLDISEALEKT